MTSDEVCLFSDKVQRFRESSDQLRFTDENVEGQRSETRLASKKKTSSEGDLCAGSFDLGVKM